MSILKYLKLLSVRILIVILASMILYPIISSLQYNCNIPSSKYEIKCKIERIKYKIERMNLNEELVELKLKK
jgi:hypothetical protein